MKKIYSQMLVGMVFIGTRVFAGDIAMQVQLPYVDGSKNRCNQNSDDSPTHNVIATQFDIDFGLGKGAVVSAAANGRVSLGNGSGFGNYIKIDHYNGYFTLYGHLMDNGYIVKDGDYVVAGQPIGFSGNTGISIGANGGYHLHFGVHNGDGVGESVRMDVKAKEYTSGGNYIKEGNFATGLNGERRDFTVGNFYESIPLSGTFNQFQCHNLDNDRGVLCWQGENGNFAFCDDGRNHTRYFKSGGGFVSQPISLNSYNVTEMCYPSNTSSVNLYAYLDGSSVGVGGSGVENLATDSTAPGLPDFIVKKLWLETTSGHEQYVFNTTDEIKIRMHIKNIGDDDVPAGSSVENRVYLSDGYRVDRSDNWIFVDKENSRTEDLDPGETDSQTSYMRLWEYPSIVPGKIYNIIACADRIYNEGNGIGKYPEKHENNNCSTEAVFSIAVPNYPPTGHLDVVNCTSIQGWAKDPNTENPIAVQVFSGDVNGNNKVLRDSFYANVYRSDVGNHAFSWVVPNALKTSMMYTLFLYALDSDDNTSVPIAQSSIMCAAPIVKPVSPSNLRISAKLN